MLLSHKLANFHQQLSSARLSAAQWQRQRQSSSNCSQMYAMFFSIFLAALTLRSAASLRRVAAPQWTLVLKIFMLPAVEVELVGQHRILATVAIAPAASVPVSATAPAATVSASATATSASAGSATSSAPATGAGTAAVCFAAR